MRSLLKFLAAFAVAFALMIFVRATGFTIYTIGGEALEPELMSGDRVLVNRWSYGLRTGGGGSLFSYGRVCRQRVKPGDLVAFEDPRDSLSGSVLICRCKAVPGDTVVHGGHTIVVPGVDDCADADYYWMQALNPQTDSLDSRLLGLISEQLIIGRVCKVVFSHPSDSSLFAGWRSERLMMPL